MRLLQKQKRTAMSEINTTEIARELTKQIGPCPGREEIIAEVLRRVATAGFYAGYYQAMGHNANEAYDDIMPEPAPEKAIK